MTYRKAAFAALITISVFTTAKSAMARWDEQAPILTLDKVLKDWETHSSELKNLEVKFTGKRSSQLSSDENFSGRLVLAKNLGATYEIDRSTSPGQPAETTRIVWNDLTGCRSIQKSNGYNSHIPLLDKDRGRLPSLMALPFLWKTNVETITSRYKVELVNTTKEFFVLSFKPIKTANPDDFAKAFLQLDRETFHPKAFFVIAADGKSSHSFKVTECRSIEELPEGSPLKDKSKPHDPHPAAKDGLIYRLSVRWGGLLP